MKRLHSLCLPACAMMLVASGCVSRTNLAAKPVAQEAIKPSSLSEYIRGIYKVSSEASKRNDQRAALLEAAPELAALVEHVEKNPTDADSRTRLVDEYLSRNLYWGAYELLTEALADRSQDPQINLNLAVIWDSWGQYDLAVQYADRAMENGANSLRAFATLGRIQLHRNRPAEALVWYGRALEHERTAPILANMGYAHILNADWPKAKESLEQALAIDDTLEQAHNNLALALAKLGDDTGALAHLLKTGRPAVAFNNMGVLYLQDNKIPEAQHYFQEALRVEPGYEIARTNLNAIEASLPPPPIIRLPAFPEAPAPPPDTAQFRFDREARSAHSD
jgi:tetratricopeptide (TPR) repeat protein